MQELVLIVEDEIQLAQILRDYLERAGFQALTVHDGEAAISAFQHKRPDLVLLDLNLPGVDGLDVARMLRRESDVPMIMVTARVDETDRLVGLELGADDYITKPFSPREVIARVRAVLRRAKAAPLRAQAVRAGDVEVDLVRHRAAVQGEPLNLTPTEFELLAVMAREPGRVFSRMQLLEATRGEAYEGYERSVDAHIKNLRAKMEPDPKNPIYVETVFGVGYRFREL